MKNLIAQIPLSPDEGFRGQGPLGLEGRASSASLITFAGFVSAAIGIITIIGTIWFVFLFITGAISIISSGGDKQKVSEARTRITTGIIGLVVLVSSIFIIDLLGSLIGLDILNSIMSIPTLLI